MTFAEWLDHGIKAGWISAPACATHDGIPATPEETEEWDEGYDPCQTVLRVWPEGVTQPSA
jgi:hypothetical protein